jgi:hypothetical protein
MDSHDTFPPDIKFEDLDFYPLNDKDLEKIFSLAMPTRHLLTYVTRSGAEDFTDHGIDHATRVSWLLQKMIKICEENGSEINEHEAFCLYAAALLHDVGCIINRENHAVHSVEVIDRVKDPHLIISGFPIDELEDYIKWIIKTHSRSSGIPLSDAPLERTYRGKKIKIRLLCGLFRLADACDLFYERARRIVYDAIEPDFQSSESKDYWIAHMHVKWIYFIPETGKIQVLVSNKEKAKPLTNTLVAEVQTVEDLLSGFFPCTDVQIEEEAD